MVSPAHSFTQAEECAGESMRHPSAETGLSGSTGKELGLVEDDAFLPQVINGASQFG